MDYIDKRSNWLPKYSAYKLKDIGKILEECLFDSPAKFKRISSKLWSVYEGKKLMARYRVIFRNETLHLEYLPEEYININ